MSWPCTETSSGEETIMRSRSEAEQFGKKCVRLVRSLSFLARQSSLAKQVLKSPMMMASLTVGIYVSSRFSKDLK